MKLTERERWIYRRGYIDGHEHAELHPDEKTGVLTLADRRLSQKWHDGEQDIEHVIAAMAPKVESNDD